MTVKIAIVAALWLTLSGVSWAQDPLNDVHVNPPPPAPTAPIAPTDPNAKPTDPERQDDDYPGAARGQEGHDCAAE